MSKILQLKTGVALPDGGVIFFVACDPKVVQLDPQDGIQETDALLLGEFAGVKIYTMASNPHTVLQADDETTMNNMVDAFKKGQTRDAFVDLREEKDSE